MLKINFFLKIASEVQGLFTWYKKAVKVNFKLNYSRSTIPIRGLKCFGFGLEFRLWSNPPDFEGIGERERRRGNKREDEGKRGKRIRHARHLVAANGREEGRK